MIKPFLIQFGKMHISGGAQLLSSLGALVVKKVAGKNINWFFAFSFFMFVNLISLKLLVLRFVTPFIHFKSIVETMPEYLSPIPIKKPIYKIMAAFLAKSLQVAKIIL